MPNDQSPLKNGMDPPAIVQEVIERSGFMVMIGTKVRKAEQGKVSLEVQRAPELLQFDGLFHGGVIASLADYAGACAAAVSAKPGVPVLTSSLNVTYLAAAKGQVLRANATCIKTGSRLRASRVEVTSDNDGTARLVAVADVVVSVNTG